MIYLVALLSEFYYKNTKLEVVIIEKTAWSYNFNTTGESNFQTNINPVPSTKFK